MRPDETAQSPRGFAHQPLVIVAMAVACRKRLGGLLKHYYRKVE